MARNRQQVLDDLIGGSDEREVRLAIDDLHAVRAGVSIPWLMKAFRMGRGKVETSLVGLQPIATGQNRTPLYDLPSAASRLVPPKIDLERVLATVKPDALPDRLREAYWNAKLKEQRYQERAGDLWRTERVISLFSETLQEVRNKLTIIPDQVQRAVGLTPQQLVSVTQIVDAVQDEIYKFILGAKDRNKTPNQLGEEHGDDEEDLI